MDRKLEGSTAGRELRVLILEDALADAELCERELKRAGLRFVMQRVETRPAYEKALDEFTPDLIISDFSLPNAFDGLTALDLARSKLPEVPFVFVSGTIGEERAVEAMKRGATDYVLKDRLSRLSPVVMRAIQEAAERAARKRAEETLRETEEKYRLLWETTNDAVILMDGETRIQYANPAVMKVFGYAPEEVTGREIAMLQPERLRDAHRKGVRRYLETGVKTLDWRSTEVVALHRDGHEFPVEISFSSMDTAGLILFGGFMRDITDRKNQELKINRLNRILAVLSGINSAIVRIRNRQELFEEACRIAVDHGGFGIAWIGIVDPTGTEITPVASAGLEDNDSLKSAKLVLRGNVPQRLGLIARVIAEHRPAFSNDITMEPEAGGERRAEAIRRGYRSVIALPLMVEGSVVGNLSLFAREPNFFDDEEMKLLTELAGDISFALEHIGKEEKLNYLAYYDVLTGLPNRQLFIDRLSQQLRARSEEPRMVALILLDLERLRNINETLGRHGGDELLRLVARRLEHVFHGTDVVARIGADGYGIVMPGMRDAEEIAHAVENRVLGCFREPFVVNDRELRVAAKTGIALHPDDGGDADTLFKNAEAALRKAKDSGERYLFYTAEMNARAAQSLSLETRLRMAVDAQQFVLHYQPKIELAGGRIRGLEALIRWQDPASGLVAPAVFITMLEETGLIHEVGRWALAQALADYRAWTARGRTVPRIAVNVSAIQLRQKDFVDVVTGAARQAGGLSHALELEITESLIMKDVETSIRKLSALREQGMHITVDDFGTGYSSLSYIARLPIDILKIDRSFISGLANGEDATPIVTTIIALAHSLNLRVVAEGVETEEQAQLLRLLKCDEMQGYLFSRPLPAAEVEAKFLAAAAV